MLFLTREELTPPVQAEGEELPAWPQPSACLQARPPPAVRPGGLGALPGAASVTVVCEEGCAGGRGAVALVLRPRQLPVLAVVENLPSPCPPVQPPPPPLGVRVRPGHIHVPARSFTAAKTGKVLVSKTRREEGQDLGRGLAGVTEDTTRAPSKPRALGNTDLTHTLSRTDVSVGKPWGFLCPQPGHVGRLRMPTSWPPNLFLSQARPSR